MHFYCHMTIQQNTLNPFKFLSSRQFPRDSNEQFPQFPPKGGGNCDGTLASGPELGNLGGGANALWVS